jgi:uncharacterized protein (DUF58 family)
VTSRALGRALEFADYRAYVPGDDPRLVDWRAYNRLDRLYLKQYREERARTISLLVDASASLDWGQADAHKGLFARRLAATLAWVALGRLEQVQVFILQGDRAAVLPTSLGRNGAAALFGSLADTSETGGLDFAAAVRDALRNLRGEGPLFLISDFLDAEWASALRVLAPRNQADVLIQVLAPEEWDPPLGDEVELQDAETGELRPTRCGPAEHRNYQSRLARFLADVTDLSRRLGLRHVALDTGEPLADVILKRLTSAGILQ